MPVGGPIPQELLAVVAAATIFAVMLTLGLGVDVGEFRWVWRHRALLGKSLFSVLVVVPAIAIAVTNVLDLSRAATIGIVLMAISPGAPIALKRSLGAGGHSVFAPALQILVTLLAVVSMPLSVAALDVVYEGHAVVEPMHIMQQVFMAQLLPLGLGMAIRRMRPTIADRVEPKLARAATLLLLLLTVAVIVDVWQPVADAGSGAALAIAMVTALALASGHALGGPHRSTRTALAVCSAARNPGLALLVATANHAPPAIEAAVLAYLVVSGLLVVAYVVWRHRGRVSPAGAGG